MLAVLLVLHILQGRMGSCTVELGTQRQLSWSSKTKTLVELEKLIEALKPNLCMLDPLPSKFPSSFKAAVIKQLLKKPGLEPELIRNSANILNSAYIEPSFPVKDTVKDCSKSSLSDHEQSLQTFSVH